MENSLNVKSLILRYVILILLALPNLWIFYFIFTSLTLYPVYFLLSLFYETSLSGTTILVMNKFQIELIGACIAGAAYYLLLILNLSTPKIKFKKRIKMISFSLLVFLIMNIFRIFILSIILVNGSSWFDFFHKFLWYFGSTVFVVLIWIAEIRYFKIKKIPFYSDLKFFLKEMKKSKRSQKNKNSSN